MQDAKRVHFDIGSIRSARQPARSIVLPLLTPFGSPQNSCGLLERTTPLYIAASLLQVGPSEAKATIAMALAGSLPSPASNIWNWISIGALGSPGNISLN
jgi:hypothetical protein